MTVTTDTPNGASSWRRISEYRVKAAFEAEYVPMPRLSYALALFVRELTLPRGINHSPDATNVDDSAFFSNNHR